MKEVMPMAVSVKKGRELEGKYDIAHICSNRIMDKIIICEVNTDE
jgi:rRNA pseudouridine-1189 N-methylase Emg1 (Nep1/Mra1 family)